MLVQVQGVENYSKTNLNRTSCQYKLILDTGRIYLPGRQGKKRHFIDSDVDEALRLWLLASSPTPYTYRCLQTFKTLQGDARIIITTSSLQDKPRNDTRGYRLSAVVFHDQEISNINYLTWRMWVYMSHQICQQKHVELIHWSAIQQDCEQLTLFGRCLRNEGWWWWTLQARRRGEAHFTHSSLCQLLTQMNLPIPYQSTNLNPAHTKHWLIFYSNEHGVTFVLTNHQFR